MRHVEHTYTSKLDIWSRLALGRTVFALKNWIVSDICVISYSFFTDALILV